MYAFFMSIEFSSAKPLHKHEKLKEGVPAFSVVIPAHNEEDTIEELLYLLLQEVQNDDLNCEILVSDSASSDKTAEVVRQFIEYHPGFHIYLISSPKGVSQARNNGATHAQNDYVFFLDADTRFAPGFLKKSMKEFVQRDLDAAGFDFVPSTQDHAEKIMLGINNLVQDVLQHSKKPLVTGAALIAKKSSHEQAGGFPTDMTVFEDSEWARRIAAEGKFGILKPKAIFETSRFHHRKLEFIGAQLKNAVHFALHGEIHQSMKNEYKKDRKGRDV